MSDHDLNNFENMMKLAEFGAHRHNERRQVIFRIFISYMTLLVIIAGLIMKHWKDDPIESLWFVISVSVFLGVLFWFYQRWLRIFYTASDYDVRRRDFYLIKAQVISYYMSKGLSQWYSDCEKVYINLANQKHYKISEKCLFDKRRPDIDPDIALDIDPQSCQECLPKPNVSSNAHYRFHICGPAGLTILIIFSLVSRPLNIFISIFISELI